MTGYILRPLSRRTLAVILMWVMSLTARAAEPSEVKEQSVTFHADAVNLSGTLLRPIGEGPHPAIVLLPGSGPGPRQQLRMFAERFVRLGFAALIFDKRGSGSSEGSWTEESLDDLAGDALAATNFLKAQPSVDSRRVGVWGISQSGWVIPRAVARAPEAWAFAVIVTGGGVRPLQIEEHDYVAALDHAGVAGEARRTALALVEKYFTYLRTGDDRPGLEKSIEAERQEPWFSAVDVGRVLPAESARSKWEWVATYDPASDIQKMTTPVLVVLGGKDRPELTAEWTDAWRRNLTVSGDATVVEFLNGEHGAAVAGTHHQIHSGGPPTYVIGYLDIVDAWLRAHAASTAGR